MAKTNNKIIRNGKESTTSYYDTIYMVHARGYLTRYEYEKIQNKGDYALEGDWLDGVTATYDADQYKEAADELAKHTCEYQWNSGNDVLVDEWVLIYVLHSDADEPDYFDDVEYDFAEDDPDYTFAESKKPAWERD